MYLENRVALVTGAAQGVGHAIALALAREGATTWVLDVKASVQDVADEIRAAGGTAGTLIIDISDSAEVNKAVSRIERESGALDILINVAAIQNECPLLEIDDDMWARQLAVTLSGTFYCTRAAARGMIDRGFGRIVNFSSIAATRGSGLACHYGAAKAGVLGLTKSLARELGPRGITINTVAPGFVLTPMTAERAASRREAFMRQIPVGYFAEPDDLVGTVLLLVTPSGRYINGQTIHVNGGWYLA